jgi:hypothetical protein
MSSVSHQGHVTCTAAVFNVRLQEQKTSRKADLSRKTDPIQPRRLECFQTTLIYVISYGLPPLSNFHMSRVRSHLGL